MTDNFAGFAASLTSPGEVHYVVVPSDTDDLDPRPRALKCIGAGTVVVRDVAGTPSPPRERPKPPSPPRPAAVLEVEDVRSAL